MAAKNKKHELKKELGLFEIVVFTVGAVLGTGIFIMPALIANIVGTFSLWVWVIIGVLTIFMAVCIAELASIYPHAGGPYKFVKEAFGRFPGFMAGWCGWLISWLTIATLAAAISYYISYLVPLSQAGQLAVAVGALAVLTSGNYFGIKWGFRVQFIFTVFAILVLWTFVTWGIYHIQLMHYTFESTAGLSAIFIAMVLVIEPYIGWETATYLSEECKNPRKHVPIAIIFTSIVIALFYGAVIFVTLGVIEVEHLRTSLYPLAVAGEAFLGRYGGLLMAFGSIAVLIGCLNSWIVTSARLPYALARDGLFPEQLSHVHEKHRTPHKSLFFQFLFASFAVLLGTFEQLIFVLVTLAMVLYMLSFLSIPVFRRVKKVRIPFRVPLGEPIAIIAIATAIFVLVNVKPLFAIIGFILIGCGVPVYYFMDLVNRGKHIGFVETFTGAIGIIFVGVGVLMGYLGSPLDSLVHATLTAAFTGLGIAFLSFNRLKKRRSLIGIAITMTMVWLVVYTIAYFALTLFML